VTKILLAVAGTLILSGAAYGQPIAPGDGYRAGAQEPPTDWWSILYFVVACLGAAVVGFKSAHRTHLD
jgi:hypothetical protein